MGRRETATGRRNSSGRGGAPLPVAKLRRRTWLETYRPRRSKPRVQGKSGGDGESKQGLNVTGEEAGVVGPLPASTGNEAYGPWFCTGKNTGRERG